MIEDEKRILTNRLEEKTSKVSRISNMQLETLSQMMIVNRELNAKNIEITTLKFQNKKLRNDLEREKEFAKSFNKYSETIKYFEKLMRSPRSNSDTSRLGCTVLKNEKHPKVVKKEVTKVRTLNLPIIVVVR